METQDINGKHSYLSFFLNTENFAISVNSVLEIIELPVLTIVPNSPEFIEGILNFRGEIVPVINMHKRFNKEHDADKQKMVIVINYETEEVKLHLGLLVDEVEGVVEFELKDIRNLPDMGLKYNPEFLKGMVEINNIFMMIMDVEKVFEPQELAKTEID